MISLLFPDNTLFYEELAQRSIPTFMKDLDLDSIAEAILRNAGKPELMPYFLAFSNDYETTEYRRDIYRELNDPIIRNIVKEFVDGIHLSERYKEHYESTEPHSPQKWKWLLDSIITYYTSLETLCIRFNEHAPKAIGLYYMHRYFYDILNVEDIKKLRMKAFELNDEFDKMFFRITLNKDRATFTMVRDENDYTAKLRSLYHHGQTERKPITFSAEVFPGNELSALEEYVTELFRNKNRILFRDMETFLALNRKVVSEDVLEIVRELEFYLLISDFCNDMKKQGFPFSYAKLSKDREIYMGDCFDISLALNKSEQNSEIVFNDIEKSNYEKAIIVNGPKKSGKTTLGKAFGQVFYFAMMGLPVPAAIAKVPYVNHIYTVFDSELLDRTVEQVIRSELKKASDLLSDDDSGRSVIVVNELFQKAPTVDALAMNRAFLERLLTRRAFVFYISDTPEMVEDTGSFVTLSATVMGDGSNRRTYRIIRRNPEDISYADSIVDKYKLNYSHIDFRIKNNSGEKPLH